MPTRRCRVCSEHGEQPVVIGEVRRGDGGVDHSRMTDLSIAQPRAPAGRDPDLRPRQQHARDCGARRQRRIAGGCPRRGKRSAAGGRTGRRRRDGHSDATLSPREFPDRAAYDAALVATAVAAMSPRSSCSRASCEFSPPGFIDAFAGRILNMHPSLLPKYRGLHTHRRALEAGDATHGVSVHFVTAELDGGPVIIQSLRRRARRTTRKRAFQREFSSRNTGSIRKRSTGLRAAGCNCMRRSVWLDGRLLDAPVIVDARNDGG